MEVKKNKSEKNLRTREMPHNSELEKEVLGAIMSDVNVAIDLFSIVSEEDFYETRNQNLYNLLRDKFTKGLACDISSIIATATEDEKDTYGGVVYLNEVLSYYYSSAAVLNNAKELKRLHKLREIIKITDVVQTRALNSEDAQNVLGAALQSFTNLSKDEDERDFVSAYDAAEKTLDEIAEAFRIGKLNVGTPTGFKLLDEKIHGGFMPGQMIVLAARPGGGKTAYAMNIVANIVEKDKEKVVAVFNLEMKAEELIKRMLSTYTTVSANQINEPYNLTKPAYDELMASKKKFVNKLFFDDTSDISMSDISLKLKRLKAKLGRLDLVVVDHIQLLSPSDKKKGFTSRYNLITDISREVKIAAKELDVPFLVLSQMSRSIEQDDAGNNSQGQQQGQAPKQRKARMSDLRESGAIEQDADMVLFIEKADFDVEEGFDARVVNIAKNRNGINDIDLYYAWEKSAMKFHEKEVAYKTKKKEEEQDANNSEQNEMQDGVYVGEVPDEYGDEYSAEYSQEQEDYVDVSPYIEELQQDIVDFKLDNLDPED